MSTIEHQGRATLSAGDRATFHRDGVLVLRQAFDAATVARLHQRADSIRQAAEASLARGIRFAPGVEADAGRHDADHTWGVNEITRPGFFDPQLIDAIAEPAIAGAMESLLGTPRAWGQKLLWAPRACDYVLNWHRDTSDQMDSLMPYKPEANDHVQFNAALAWDPSFRVVPGSHRRALTEDEWTALRTDPYGPMPGQVHLPLEPGDILLMDAHALHRGEVPAGDPRLTLHFSFQAQWVPLKPWGEPDDFAWICSDEFRATLRPAAQAPYRRLIEAERASGQYDWLVDHARSQGWSPPSDWHAPGHTPMA